MATDDPIPASLSLDGLASEARDAFDLASSAGYRGIAFATNHPELNPDALGPSARRHVKTLLAGKRLAVESIRAAAPRGGLAQADTIDRTIDNARKAMMLARELGVKTVSLNVGNLTARGLPPDTVAAALRELAQHADAAGLTLAVGADETLPLAKLLKQVDYDRARMNLEPARMIAGGEDLLKTTEQLAGTFGQLTAADAVRSGSSVRAVMLGEGQTPLPELLEILQEQGFDGPLVVDVRDLPNGTAGARHAAEVLARLMRSRGA